MLRRYTVGMEVDRRPRHVTVEAEDALIAALKAKQDAPSATITYVRRTNRRGDRRHPHGSLGGSAPPSS